MRWCPLRVIKARPDKADTKIALDALVGSIGLGLLAVTMLLAMPAVWLSQTAAQTEGLLVATQKEWLRLSQPAKNS